MKLRNKKTGEIGYPYFQNWKEISCVIVDENAKQIAEYTSLSELNEEWEDCEEPKPWWYIDIHGPHKVTNNDEYYQQVKAASKEIGNYFETREEAEKAVEKLKAWKRLKDDGLKIRKYELNGGTDRNGCFTGDICLTLDISKPVYEDILQLLFGGGE